MLEHNEQFTLLLVDDNPVNLTLLAKIVELDLPQVRVLTASHAAEGLRLAGQEQIDGAFIDVQMPQMSGLDMCRELKADPHTAGILLVLITAHLASPEMRAEGLEVGAYDFISQPISNVEMLARIKVMLRLCRGERSLRQETQQRQQPAEDLSTQMRWLSGLLLAGDGEQAAVDLVLLRTLATELSAPEQLDDALLIAQLGDKFPLSWRRTFLTLALLETIPLSLARRLSEIHDIEAVFDYLQRHDLIFMPATARAETLCFKPQIRQLLRERLDRVLSPEEQQRASLYAANWYQQKNNLGAALECLLRAEQFPAISQLLSQTGLGVLDQRYQPQALQFLAQIPEEEAVRCGWLALFAGINCMQGQPFEVDTWLELARTRFVANDDQRGELLALSQQLLQYLIVDGQRELGLPRLLRLRQLVAQQLELLDPFNRIKVLFAQGLGELFYANDLSASEEIVSRAMAEALREKFFEQQLDLHLLQVLSALYQGRFRVAWAALEQGRRVAARLEWESFSVKVSRVIACELLFSSGQMDAFFQQHEFAQQFWGREALQQSALGPLLNFFSILASTAQGKTARAREQLDVALVENPAAARPHLQSWLLQLRGLLNAQVGRTAEAQADSELGLTLCRQLGTGLRSLPNFLLGGACAVLLQDYKQAAELLQQGLSTSIELQEERYRSGLYAWSALLHNRCGEDRAAVAALEELFMFLRRQQNDFFFALTPELLRELVPLASSRLDWSEQLQRLTRRWLDCTVTSDGRLIPLARLQTLGGFWFYLEGQCLDLSEVGQTSRQLLALLSVSVNFSMSSEVVMGTLWPESSATKARNSFDTALSRLRKALEGRFGQRVREDYLLLERGMLLLRNVRIDRLEFSQTLETARLHLQRQKHWQAELAFRQAEREWGGEFLVGFELEADLHYRSDQLNQLRLKQLEGLAHLLLLRGENSEATRLLQSGLQIDPTHDLFVQQLLDIYQQQGDVRSGRQLLASYRTVLQEEGYAPDEIDELITALGPQRLEI